MLAVTYAAVFVGFIPFLFAAASSDNNCTTVYPAVTLDGDGECPNAGTADVLDEIRQNISALLGEVVNCMTTDVTPVEMVRQLESHGTFQGNLLHIAYHQEFLMRERRVRVSQLVHG